MKKSLFSLCCVLVMAGMLAALALPVQAQPAGAGTQQWAGAWQMGPSIDAALWGGVAGNGWARITGYYWTGDERVYFLGLRAEDNNTYGDVIYFDVSSRTYGNTGVDMPVPVSNYVIVGVPNDLRGHGFGLYIVSGRTSSGAQTGAVQVYYPDENLVEQITSDPLPAAPARSVGAAAYADGKLYVWGGFDAASMYADTWVYDFAAAAGSRWTNTGCNLPLAMSYISSTAVGDLIYSIGGDTYESAALVPQVKTYVLDTNNMAACWQDAAMADLPEAVGDAPAVFVPAGTYMGGSDGAIFTVGGVWPTPGPYRFVWRYDMGTDTWEEFPELAIPTPATGRRNQAAVFVPPYAKGLGDGVPGIWTFGGYDGSGTNAMTETSEFFSVTGEGVVLLPDAVEAVGVPGSTAMLGFTLLNISGAPDTFDISYSSASTWTVTFDPDPVGPVADGESAIFTMSVLIPPEVECPDEAVFDVIATSVTDPGITDMQTVTIRAACGITGTITDTNTGEPIENAYVWMQTDPDGLTGDYYDGFTDGGGNYLFVDVTPGTYYWGADAAFHSVSYYELGWPDGAVMVTVPDDTVVDASLDAAILTLDPSVIDVEGMAGVPLEVPVDIGNDGSGPLRFDISIEEPFIIKGTEAVPGLPRLDPQVQTELDAAGSSDIVVVLASQADLSAADEIADWAERGQYVYDTLNAHASLAQTGVRRMLDAAGVSYKPLYIINALIVDAADTATVNLLLARPDVAQIVGNHQIAVEDTRVSAFNQILQSPPGPEAIGWNISLINADDVWALGYNGTGTVVAEIDTGTQWDHPALMTHYRGWNGTTADHNYNWFDPYEQYPDAPFDPGGHGTHVMGTMVGDDGGANQIGVAPGAKWISCKGGDEVSGYLLTTELLECAQWILAPTDLTGANPMPELRPHVVNNSWGGGPNDYWYSGAVHAWRAAGIFPAFANGNEGPGCSTAHSPGDYWNSYATGAIDNTSTIASFSSRGPAAYTGFLKPQITAPGVSIRSSVPGSGYALYNGTSMASPHTAGAVALLYSAAPELIGQIEWTAGMLSYNAFGIGDNEGCGGDQPGDIPNNTYGYGRLDILESVNRALDGHLPPDWVTLDKYGGEVAPGEAETITFTITPPMDALPGEEYTALAWVTADAPGGPDWMLWIYLTVLEGNRISLPVILR